MTPSSTQQRNPYYTSFPWGWHGVAYGDGLGAGEVLSRRYFARDLVAWRDAAGTPHVMDAHCPHLGAHMGEGGRVDGSNLVCPFHHWCWDGDGKNAHIPYSERTHPGARVKTYPVIERNGLVMMWYHPDDAPPSFEIPVIPELGDDAYGAPRRAHWTIRTTWQETAENGPDFIHLGTVHGTPVIPELESYECHEHVASMRSKVTYHSPRGDTPGRIDADTYGPGFSTVRFKGIIDICLIDWCVPIDFEHLENHKAYLVSRAEGDDHATSLADAFIGELKRQMDEDIRIFENKIWQPRPALIETDGPIGKFRKWASQFYTDPATPGTT